MTSNPGAAAAHPLPPEAVARSTGKYPARLLLLPVNGLLQHRATGISRQLATPPAFIEYLCA
jgi:hypothetical protein